MKYYIMAVVLIVALAGFGVQILDSNTGMAITPSMRVGKSVNWGAACSQLETEINSLVAKYEDAGCPSMDTGERSDLICPSGIKSGYKFDMGSGQTGMQGQEYDWQEEGATYEECVDMKFKILEKVANLENNAEKDQKCSNILHGLRAPLGCSEKTRAH